MPQVYMKELSTSIGAPYDLSKMMVQKYISKEVGYRDVSVKDSINDVVMSIANYQSEDGGFSYWTDPLRSDVSLTLSVLSRLQDLSRIGFRVP